MSALPKPFRSFAKPTSKAMPTTVSGSSGSKAPQPPATEPPLHMQRPCDLDGVFAQLGHVDEVAGSCVHLGDATAEHPEMVSSVTVSYSHETSAWVQTLSLDNEQSAWLSEVTKGLECICGRYNKIGDIFNGSSVFRQVQSDDADSKNPELCLIYFDGKDFSCKVAIDPLEPITK